MKRENNILLQEVVQQLLEEKKNFQDKINKNLNRISEIDAYLNSIYEKEDTDFKVFSPRSVENVYKEQIERGKAEKYSIENENKYLYRQLNRLDRYLRDLQSILIDEQIDSIDEVQSEDIVLENLEVLDILEKDRQRIARDLHDSSLQDLAHLIHVVELSSMYIDQDPVRAKLELISVNQGLKTIIDDIRGIIFDLRPMTFDDLGFAELLEDFTQKLQKHNKIPVSCEIEKIEIENQTELITLYRVIKECCLNSIKHSGCDRLSLLVKSEDNGRGILIRIQDNGMGFNVDMVSNSKRNHYGLKIVKERIALLGGSFEIQSVCDKGTNIEIHVPVLDQEVKGV